MPSKPCSHCKVFPSFDDQTRTGVLTSQEVNVNLASVREGGGRFFSFPAPTLAKPSFLPRHARHPYDLRLGHVTSSRN